MENYPFWGAGLPPYWPLFLTCCPDTFFGSSHLRLDAWFLDFLLVVVTAGRGLCRTLGPQWEGRPLGNFLTSSLTGKDPINLSTIFEPWDFCLFFDFDSSVDSVGVFFSFAFFKDSKRACNDFFLTTYYTLNHILFIRFFIIKIFLWYSHRTNKDIPYVFPSAFLSLLMLLCFPGKIQLSISTKWSMWIKEVKNKNEMFRRDENHQIQVQETVAWKKW